MGKSGGSGLIDGARPPASLGQRFTQVLTKLRIPLAHDGRGDVADHQ